MLLDIYIIIFRKPEEMRSFYRKQRLYGGGRSAYRVNWGRRLKKFHPLCDFWPYFYPALQKNPFLKD